MLGGVLQGKVIFIGVGNKLMGDDGVGPLISGKIGGIDAGLSLENFALGVSSEKPDTVVVFDALEFGGKAGEIRIMNTDELNGVILSPHAPTLSLLAKALSPARVVLIGIQPGKARLWDEMSKEVLKSAMEIAGEVSEWQKRKR